MLRKEFIREGMYAGKKYIFTHWNPANNMVWADNMACGHANGITICGCWIPSNKVTWL